MGKIFVLSYQNYDTFEGDGHISKIGTALEDLDFKSLIDEYLLIDPEFYPGWPGHNHEKEFEEWLESKGVVKWLDFDVDEDIVELGYYS